MFIHRENALQAEPGSALPFFLFSVILLSYTCSVQLDKSGIAIFGPVWYNIRQEAAYSTLTNGGIDMDIFQTPYLGDYGN